MSRAVFRLVTGITAGVATIATTVVAYCGTQGFALAPQVIAAIGVAEGGGA